MSHDDFDFEPHRGLPAELPEGERLLWQGAPDWRTLAVRAYHVRKVAVYFSLLVLWRIAVGVTEGQDARTIVVSCLFLALLGALAFAVLSLLAFLNARSTVYSITTKRVLLRHGVAVPITLNVPFKLIDNVALKIHRSGDGDLAMALPVGQRVGYLITWPHVRPGRFTRPQPGFRALPDAQKVAQILEAALTAESGANAARGDVLRQRAPATPPGALRSAGSRSAAVA